MKLTQFWQQLMLRFALIGAVLAVCVMWGGLVTPVSAESTALVRIIRASPGTGSVNVFVNGSKVANNLQFASVPISNNASGSPQSVALSGRGISAPAQGVTLTPDRLSFGDQVVKSISAVQMITLQNDPTTDLTDYRIRLGGNNPGDFRLVVGQTNNDCPTAGRLPAGASCIINVTFTPTATGSRSASVTITKNASSSSPQSVGSVALTGTGLPGMSQTGSDPYAQPPADNTQQVPLGWLALIVAVVAAAGIGTALISGRLGKSRPR